MSLVVFNTLSRKKEPFEPLQKGKVGMYVCGPTVYNYIHVGNARPMVFFDVVARYLKFKGYQVTHVRNITDIDDKIIKRSQEEKKTAQEIAQRYEEVFVEDMKNLGLETPEHSPHATEYIKEMISMIEALIEKGIAYEAEAEVLFSIKAFKPYGTLSKKPLEELEAGARVEVVSHKRAPGDFVLWKPSKADEPAWESPWGSGRPGWHLECSVMSTRLLGEAFDIHGAGVDLVFPHHENEIAQSQACSGKAPVKYWLHNEMISFGKEKMSKSLGNIVTTHEFIEKYPPELLKLILLSCHYRTQMEFSESVIKDNVVALERVYKTLSLVEKRLKENIISDDKVSPKLKELVENAWSRIESAMDDDFNTAEALGVVFENVRAINRYLKDNKKLSKEGKSLLKTFSETIEKISNIWGLFGQDPKDYLNLLRIKLLPQVSKLKETDIEKLIEQRQEARKNKDFKKADEIREKLKQNNIVLEDSPSETLWNIQLS